MANHDERIQAIIGAAAQANQRLLDALNALPEQSTQVAPTGAWNAAQLGVHVALTNSLVAAILRGDLPIARPASADFVEDWGRLTIPEKITTMPQLEPAPDCTRVGAIAQLNEAQTAVAGGLKVLTAERGAMCVDLPFGTINLYQLGEFVAAHSDRHLAQLKRLPVVA